MSKKPQRSRHRVGPVPWFTPKPVELDESYENEVRRSTEKLERLCRRAEKRVEQAEARLRAARERVARPATRKATPKRHTIVELEFELAERRRELEEFRRMMVAVPASATHRGTSSYRPVPVTHREFGD